MKVKKLLTIIIAVGIIALPFYGQIPKVKALAITAMSITGTGIASGSSAVSTAITPVLTFTLGTTLTSGQTLRIVLNGVTVSAVAGLASTDITASNGCSGTVTLAGSPIAQNTNNPILSITGLACSTSSSTLTFAAAKLTTLSTAGNNTIPITTPVDNGAFLYYIGNANQVNISAQVDPILSFVIRASDDNSDLTPGTSTGARICNMGTLTVNTTPAGPSTNACQYRLRIATNAANGFTASYLSTSADTTGGGFARLAASTTINIPNQVGGNSGDALSASNGYGVILTPGSGLTRGTTFGATAGNFYTITATGSTQMISASAPYAPNSSPDTTNTTLITHGARIGISQNTGAYTHTITYTVTGNF